MDDTTYPGGLDGAAERYVRASALGVDAIDINIILHTASCWWTAEGKPALEADDGRPPFVIVIADRHAALEGDRGRKARR